MLHSKADMLIVGNKPLGSAKQAGAYVRSCIMASLKKRRLWGRRGMGCINGALVWIGDVEFGCIGEFMFGMGDGTM